MKTEQAVDRRFDAKELFISVRTVSTYRARILEKMQMKTNADLIRYALQHKLID